jgi:hypothetical protein
MTSALEKANAWYARLTEAPYPSTPGLWPIRAAAVYVGISVNGLQAGIDNGDIPVLVHRVGPSGKRYVHVEQLVAWVNGTSTPRTEANLF